MERTDACPVCDRVAASDPLAGLRGAGWDIAYDDTPNPFAERVQQDNGTFNFSSTLGVWIDREGTIQDVASGSIAARHGMASGWRIVGIDDHAWSVASLRSALRDGESSRMPVKLRLAYADVTRTVELDWHSGLREPHLRRLAGTPDVLQKLLAPRRSPSPHTTQEPLP